MNDHDGPLLQLDSVYKSFGGSRRGSRTVQAATDVSFTVVAGETLAIIGESGSGKTTVARIALGLTAPDRGSVRVMGVDQKRLRGRAGRQLRRSIQPVFQDATASLNPRRSVNSTLTQAIRSGLDRSSAHKVRDLCLEALDRVGLRPATDFMSRYPHELSGGQRQRLAVARAISARPRLIIADEPLSGADASVRGQLLNMLEDLQRDLGLAYVLITHDISVARAFAHRTIVMTNGQIVEQGDPAVVLGDPAHEYTKELIAAVPHIDRSNP